MSQIKTQQTSRDLANLEIKKQSTMMTNETKKQNGSQESLRNPTTTKQMSKKVMLDLQRKKVLDATEKNYLANNLQLSKKFEKLATEQNTLNKGETYKLSPRIGAGSLGPNYQQKAQQFLPIIRKTNEFIKMREELKIKLNKNAPHFFGTADGARLITVENLE